MKNESVKHTPGPWTARGSSVLISDPETRRVCDCAFMTINPTESHANARLIAAAPELLEACKALYDGAMESSGFAQSTTAIKARAAIAKATGSEVCK